MGSRFALPADIRWRVAADLHSQGEFMLQTIAIVLLILWLLGFVSSYTIGGFIHILLVVALVMILVNFIQGRKSL